MCNVPGLGIFTLRRRSSRYEDGVFYGPETEVCFDNVNSIDDNSLIESIVRREKIDMAAAEAVFNAEFAALRHELEGGFAVEIDDIGTLKLNRQGFVMFNACKQASWFKALRVSMVETVEPTEEEIAQVTATLKARREELSRSLRRTASSAAAIAVFVLLTFVVSQLPGRRNSQPQMASIGMETIALGSTDDATVLPEAEAEPSLVLILNTPDDGTAPAEKEFKAETEAQPEADRYFMVVASLASKTEAETFINAHSTDDMPLNILNNDNRWRVYVMSAPEFDALNTMANNAGIYNTYPSAWICRK